MRCVFLLLFPLCLCADKVILPQEKVNVQQPWLTGPLLAPSSAVVPVGHANYEPYFYVTATTGNYTKDWSVQSIDTLWSGNFEPTIQVGLTSWMNVQIIPIVSYNYTQHNSCWVFGDFPFQLAFQLYSPKGFDSWAPYVKLTLTEIFPTGKYRNLDPQKKGVDIGGLGSFNTQIALVIGKSYYFGGVHYLLPRLSLQYSLPAPTQLKGFNAYGGGYGTNARFFPAQNFQVDLGVEFTLTQNWVLACDFVGTWSGKTHFTGTPGIDSKGQVASLGSASSVQYALAPALEYNWSENLGLIGGCWFTMAGRNSPQFFSIVIALNYYQ